MARNTIKQDEQLKAHTNSEIFKRLARYIAPFKFKVLLVLLLIIVAMLCDLLNPYLLKIAIDNFIQGKNIKGLLILGGIMLALAFILMYVSRCRMVLMGSITNKILLNIRQELYVHIQKLSFSFFDNRPVGKILSRIIGDVNSLQDLFNSSITSFIPDILSLLCVIVMMFSLNFKLACATVLILPLLFAGMFGIETFSRKRWQMYRKKRSNMNAYTHENFSGIRIVQGYAVEKTAKKSFADIVIATMDSFVHAVKLNDFFWPLVEISWGIGMFLVYCFGTKLVYSNSISVGTLIAFTMYIGMFWRPIMDISNFYNSIVTNFAAADRIFEILDMKPDIADLNNVSEMPPINGQVEFKNVSFSYEDGVNVIDNVSFKIKPGETVALVGPTGAGKTTLVNLIGRFYDVTGGQILIDGRDIKNVSLESLRSQMGIMLQDTFLFSATIKENIRYGKLDATDEEIIRAAKAVDAHDFIMSLENGYDTQVNERGSRLSVGQRQLISFARALLANPRILILDEATSNIDTYTERMVQNGIKKLLAGRTSFVIAHRLSTIRDCDRIMVVSGGKITEKGNHRELMKKKGLYYDLYMSQYKFLNEGA